MAAKKNNYLSLALWILTIVLIGWIIGSLTKAEVDGWYNTLNRSPFTPPNIIFPITWTLLYVLIAVCGWRIWQTAQEPTLPLIKGLFIVQLLLNWSWTPLFFHYHLVLAALVCIVSLDIAVALIIYLTWGRMRTVSLLMIPYLGWISFATYLNFYIWHANNFV